MLPTPRATSIGASRTKRCIGSSTTSSGRSAPTSWGVGCMRSCVIGIVHRLTMTSRQRGRSTRRSGRSLNRVSAGKTRIEREFQPEAIKHLKATATRDVSVGGPTLAAQALKLGLVDECHLLLSPVVLGGGNPALPDNVRLGLELLDERRWRGPSPLPRQG